MRNLGSFVGEGGVMKLAIELSEAQERRLAEIAGRLNVPAESLAEAAVRELVAQPDEDFDHVASRILEKNQELYERLG
jgi:predicted transcriptional regulator